jgi:hypothetical protein
MVSLLAHCVVSSFLRRALDDYSAPIHPSRALEPVYSTHEAGALCSEESSLPPYMIWPDYAHGHDFILRC